MRVYTVKFYNRFGPVRRSLKIECASDDDAIQFAATTGSDLKVELWQEDRRVWRFEPLVRWMPRSRVRWFWERQSDLTPASFTPQSRNSDTAGARDGA